MAARVADGTPPDWADSSAERFYLINDIIVQIKIADRQLRAVDQRGGPVWELHLQSAVAVDTDLFVIDGEPASSLTLLDPRTGESRWQTPSVRTATVGDGSYRRQPRRTRPLSLRK